MSQQFRSFMAAATKTRVDAVIRSVFAAVGDDICQHCIIDAVVRECRAEHIRVSRGQVDTRVKELWGEVASTHTDGTGGYMTRMTRALTRTDLDPLVCSTPGCSCEGDLFLRSKCHPDDATWVKYNKATGSLEVSCATCEQLIAVIGVAREAGSTSGAILQ